MIIPTPQLCREERSNCVVRRKLPIIGIVYYLHNAIVFGDTWCHSVKYYRLSSVLLKYKHRDGNNN